MFGDSSVLLKNPELVADTWLNFASALWSVPVSCLSDPSPQVLCDPPAPQAQHAQPGGRLVDTKPGRQGQAGSPPIFGDGLLQAQGLVAGLGATTMAINGAIGDVREATMEDNVTLYRVWLQSSQQQG